MHALLHRHRTAIAALEADAQLLYAAEA